MSGSHCQPSHGRIAKNPARDKVLVTPSRRNAAEVAPRAVEVQQGTRVSTSEQVLAEGNLDHSMTASLPPLCYNNVHEDRNDVSSILTQMVICLTLILVVFLAQKSDLSRDFVEC